MATILDIRNHRISHSQLRFLSSPIQSAEKIDGDSTLVSPENSEDGVLPPIGEIPTIQQPPGSLLAPQTFNSAVAAAPVPTTTFPVLPTQVPSLGANQLMQPHAKRQRVEAPPVMAAIASSVSAPPMLSGQQLAQAAQVLQQQQQQGQGRGRKKSQTQINRRRERNRILARRTRLRKKFFFESLQKEVMDLQRENMRLKDLIKANVDGDESKKILDECDAMEKLPPSVMEALGEVDMDMDSQDFNLVSSIQKSQHAFVITDPSLQDNPIVFASDDFLKITGYTREQVLGRNCRFLQGSDTSKEKLDMIRKGLAAGEDVSVTLLNYTADGTPFWNKLFIASLRDAQNNIVNYIGVTVKVAQPPQDDPEHGKPLPMKTLNPSAPAAAEDTVKAIEGAVTAAVAASAAH